MKLKTLALAAVLLSAGTAGSQAATFTTGTGSASGTLGILNAYTTWLSSWSSVFEGIYGVGSQGGDWDTFGVGSYTASLGGLGSVTVKRSSSFLSSDFDPVNFVISGNGNSATASYTTYIATVPGPEAGAGLGALALGGVAYLATRRRKEAAAA